MGNEDWLTERRFLLAIGKLATSLVVAVAWVLLVLPQAPNWLVQLVGVAIVLFGFDWALRGTPFKSRDDADGR